MRISTFVPAVLALTLFSASQAAPTLMKRDRANVNAIVNIFNTDYVHLFVDSITRISLDVCADVDIKLDLDAKVANGLVTFKADVEKLRLSAKAQLDSEIKAKVKADATAIVIAPISAIIDHVVVDLCPLLETQCFKEKASNIVTRIIADVDVLIKNLWVIVQADLPAHIRLRAKVIIREIGVHAGLADATISGRVFIASNINAHVQTWTHVWATIDIKARLVADIQLL